MGHAGSSSRQRNPSPLLATSISLSPSSRVGGGARAREAQDVARVDESGEGDGRLMEDLVMIWMDQWCLGSIARGVR